jgi:hypothetical protein
MHLTSAIIFFQDYLHFAVCLHDFFFSDVMAGGYFGGIFTPLPGFLGVQGSVVRKAFNLNGV